MKYTKKALALLLALCMMVPSVPFMSYAAEDVQSTATEASTIIAMSDYQNSSLSSDGKKQVPQTIVHAMVNAGVTPELALIGGDYTDGSVGADGDDQSQASLKTEFGNLTGILTSAWSNLPYYAIQGNHDYSGFLTDGTLDETGAYNQENYNLYLINEDDFPWWQGNYGSGSSTTEDKATVTATANNLKEYLDGLISSGDTKPVIIMTHVPMHWSERSTAANWYYDNIYANILFDVVNEAGKELDILFMFGHNHSSTASGGDYDYEIGGALAYVAKGESMKVPNGTDGTSNYTTETLNFTYMNAGYVGKYAGNTANCSISAITIDSDSIDIDRYTYNGTVYEETISLTDDGTSSGGSSSGDGTTTTPEDSETTGEWITISGTPATTSTGKFYHVEEELIAGETYLLVSNDTYLKGIQDTGESYSKTTSGDVITYDTTIALQTMTTDSDSTGDYIETTDESLMWKAVASSIDGYFYLQNVETGAFLRAGYAFDDTYGRNINTTDSTSDTYTSFKAVSGSNYGIYAVESNSNTSNHRWVRYSNSNAWYQGRTSYQSGAAQLWKAETTTSGEATLDSYARLTGETVQSYDVSQATTASYVLGNLKIETSTDGSTVAETVSVTSNMVTWNKTFNGSVIGTYTGTIVYEGVTLGTVTVHVSGTATEVEGEGDWIELPNEYTFVIDNDGIDYGEEYLIVSTYNQYALDTNETGTSVYGVTATLNGSGDTKTATIPESYLDTAVWTITQNSGIYNRSGEYVDINSSGYSGDNASYFRTMAFSNRNNRNWTIGQSGDYYTFTTRANSISFKLQVNSYRQSYMYTRNETSNLTYELYKLTETDNSGYARLTGTLEQVYTSVDAATLSTVLGRVSIQTSTDQSAVAETVAVTSNMVTWDTTFDGSTAGTYTGTVTYKGQVLGTIKVTILPVSVASIELVTAEGSVTRGASSNAITGGKIKVTYSDGTTEERDVVLGMLNNDGKTEGTYSGLTVTFGGKTADGFTLTVEPRKGNNYPEYPEGGSVDVNKVIGDYNQFQNTGVAEVQLSTSGIPMNEGIDVVVVLDTSSSMQETVEGFSSSRLTILRPAVNSLIEQLQTIREDGSDPDLDIAMVAFNGFTGDGNSSTQYGADNYIEVQAYATPNAGGWLTDETGDGWVDIMDLSTNWADEEQGNIDTGSGTNYDEGLLMAYKLLEVKQQGWAEGEVRKQYVVFMSDGAPFQYNGVYSNYTSDEWNNWLLGNYDMTDASTENDIPNTVKNTEYYAGYAGGLGQDHCIAEAIKGDPSQKYQIVTTTADTNGTTELETVNGLGATLYSIGYLLADNGQVTKETQDIVLENIASSSELYFDVTTAEELDNAFSNIASSVKMAATNAYFVDQMGDAFSIQMSSTITKFAGTDDETTITLNPAPQITVSTYNIYNKKDIGETINGIEVTQEMVGQRYGSANVVETVKFNDHGTEAYSSVEAYGIEAGKNIINDGVICASNFFYNTTSETKTITLANGDEYDLPAETFYWNIGTINETEFVLSYYVYLEGSAEGTAEAGTYNTNNYATLYYKNWLENDAYQDAQSPSLAWESASVYYGFYLVDSAGNPVVNQTTGETGSFADAVKVTQKIFYEEVLLNDITQITNIRVASTKVPEGYTVYDNGASYTITIDSNKTISGWVIENTKAPDTTYVTDYRGAESTHITNSDNLDSQVGVDYTATTVWFAVIWEPQCIPDVVVVDYGLPVDITVLGNDMFGTNGKLIGIGSRDKTPLGTYTTSDSEDFTDAYVGTYGSAGIMEANAGVAGSDGQKVRYTPTTMQFGNTEQFAYEVEYTPGTDTTASKQYYYGNVTVIPATTIYYEDSFVTFTDGVSTEDESVTENRIGSWSTAGTENTTATQDEDRPGQYSMYYIDANNVYGYDSAYAECTEYSLGSAKKVTVSAVNNPSTKYNPNGTAGSWPTATFTFTGSGFDIISLTSSDTGLIKVDVTGTENYSWLVDTYYGYNYNDETGKWEVSPTTDNALYQIPVIKSSKDMVYGTYTVTITVMYSSGFDHASAGSYDFYLDAIRVYDPANDGAGNTTIENAYIADKEGWPAYTELRNMIITAEDFYAAEGETKGVIFIDGIPALEDSETNAVSDYTAYGPNNEVYLAPGQAIAFNLNAGTWNEDGTLNSANIASIQLAVKGVNEEVTYKIYDASDKAENAHGKTVKTATDLYYEDIKALNGKTVVIVNTSDSETSAPILSITNLKVTFNDAPEEELDLTEMLTFNPGMEEQVVMSLRRTVVDDSTTSGGTTEGEVEEDNTSSEDKTISSVAEAFIRDFLETINWIKNFFRR